MLTSTDYHLSWILTKAEEDCVHTHSIHTEESVCNEIGANNHSLQLKKIHSKLSLTQSAVSLLTSNCEQGLVVMQNPP